MLSTNTIIKVLSISVLGSFDLIVKFLSDKPCVLNITLYSENTDFFF